MKACNLCNLDFLKTDFEISRATSASLRKQTTSFRRHSSASQILCYFALLVKYLLKPKELEVISQYLQLIPVSLRQIPKTSRILSHTSCITYGYFFSLSGVYQRFANISPTTLLKFSSMLLLVLSLTTVTHFYMVFQNT